MVPSLRQACWQPWVDNPAWRYIVSLAARFWKLNWGKQLEAEQWGKLTVHNMDWNLTLFAVRHLIFPWLCLRFPESRTSPENGICVGEDRGEDWSFNWALTQTPSEACFWSPFSEATAPSTFHQSAQLSVCWGLKVLACFLTTYLFPLLRFCPQPHGLLSTLAFSLSLLAHTYFTLYYHVSGISEASQQAYEFTLFNWTAVRFLRLIVYCVKSSKPGGLGLVPATLPF